MHLKDFWRPLAFVHVHTCPEYIVLISCNGTTNCKLQTASYTTMIPVAKILVLFFSIGRREQQCSSVSWTFQPYVCAILSRIQTWKCSFQSYVCPILSRIQSWKCLESEFWFCTCFSNDKNASVDICKDSKAIRQLTLRAKSHTGFFWLLLQTNILSYQWLAGGFWNGKEMSEWLFWGQWINILQSLKAMLSELKVCRRPEKLFCS